MSRSAVAVASLLAALLFPIAHTGADPSSGSIQTPTWQASEGLAVDASDGRFVLVYVRADVDVCRAVERDVLSNPQVVGLFAAHFRGVRLDLGAVPFDSTAASEEQRRSFQWMMSSFSNPLVPAVAVFEANGCRIADLSLLHGVDAFREKLERIVARDYMGCSGVLAPPIPRFPIQPRVAPPPSTRSAPPPAASYRFCRGTGWRSCAGCTGSGVNPASGTVCPICWGSGQMICDLH